MGGSLLAQEAGIVDGVGLCRLSLLQLAEAADIGEVNRTVHQLWAVAEEVDVGIVTTTQGGFPRPEETRHHFGDPDVVGAWGVVVPGPRGRAALLEEIPGMIDGVNIQYFVLHAARL